MGSREVTDTVPSNSFVIESIPHRVGPDSIINMPESIEKTFGFASRGYKFEQPFHPRARNTYTALAVRDKTPSERYSITVFLDQTRGAHQDFVDDKERLVKVRGPNVEPIVEAEELSGNAAFIVTPALNIGSLCDLLSLRDLGAGHRGELAAYVLLGVLRGLETIHSADVLHLDVK